MSKIKITVVTPTFNRKELLPKLYESLIQNRKEGINIKWEIMDDGSTDGTKELVESWIKENKISISYQFQENQGKMVAINKLVEKAEGDILIECDSDDYFTPNAFAVVEKEYEKIKGREDIYAICFLKYNKQGENMGKMFPEKEITMFDLYFKRGENGEKALAFLTSIRKQYKHELENGEKFVTEARMYHKMDQSYHMVCTNEPIMICEYQEQGYTQNIQKQFAENPYGYYEYFKEIFLQDLMGVTFSKRLYVIKHYILFCVLTNQKQILKPVKGTGNKMLVAICYLLGKYQTKRRFMKRK